MFDFSCIKKGSLIADYAASDRHVLTDRDGGIGFKDTYDVFLYVMKGSCFADGIDVQTGGVIYIPSESDCLISALGECELCAVYFTCYEKNGDTAFRRTLYDSTVIQSGTEKGCAGNLWIL